MIRRFRRSRRRPIRREAETEDCCRPRPRRRRVRFTKEAIAEGEELVERLRSGRLRRREEPAYPRRVRRTRGRNLDTRRERDAYTPMRAELTREMDSLEGAASDLLEAIDATRRLLPSRGRLGPARLDQIAENVSFMKDFTRRANKAIKEIEAWAMGLSEYAESVPPSRGR